MPVFVLDPAQRRFIEARRTATLATLSKGGLPRLVPICFVVLDAPGESPHPVLYSPLDEKPKRDRDVRRLARALDIAERPGVTLLFERWSEDWSQLAWLRARGEAALVEAPDDGDDAHRRAVLALRVKYPQYAEHDLERRPMIRIVLGAVLSWSASDDV